jgi:hypothetical protein
VTNPFEEFLGGIGNALDKALNPEPTDAAVYERDGKLYLRLVYGDTSGGDINIVLPKKDLSGLVKGITDYLLKS